MLKVLHLISGDLWAGAEAQAYALISGLTRVPDIEVSAAVLNEGVLAHRLRDLDIRVHVVDERRLGPLGVGRALAGVIRAERPAVIHSHRYKENVLGGLASRWAGRPRLVRTVHGLRESFGFLKRMKSDVYGLMDQWVTRLCFDRVICVSQDMLNRLQRDFRREQLVCIPNGITVEACTPARSRDEVRAEWFLGPDVPILGYAGRLVGIKGLNFLLEAMKQLVAVMPDCSLLIVGSGPELEALRLKADSLGIQKRVIFTGHRDDVYDLIAALDVFVLPSLSEGIPMVLLEAMAIGTPIVATRVGGVPEILTHQETGLLVEAGDPSQLADACTSLLSDPASARRMVELARTEVREQHSATAMTHRVAALYRSLV